MGSRQELSRRQALKVISAAVGGAALSLLPKVWKTPIVEVGALPAHAQVSQLPTPTPAAFCPGDLCAVATTKTLVEGEARQEYGDFDFSMCTPNGTYVWGGSGGDGATSSPDNVSFDPHADSESLDIGEGAAVPGTYSIYLELYEDVPLEMAVQIMTAAGMHSTALSLEQNRAVADVVFPGGQVTWRSDLTYPPCLLEQQMDKKS